MIKGRVKLESTIFSDHWKGYNRLIDLGYNKHYRIKHSEGEYAKKQGRVKVHINGIEGFWGCAKMRLLKFRGMNKGSFFLHLKECEFRFNNRNKNIYKILLSLFR